MLGVLEAPGKELFLRGGRVNLMSFFQYLYLSSQRSWEQEKQQSICYSGLSSGILFKNWLQGSCQWR